MNNVAEVAVAIDKDKGSQYALKWAVDNLVSKGQPITLIHVKSQPSISQTGNHVNISKGKDEVARRYKRQLESQAREIFLPFRCFCTGKEIKCDEVILEDTNIAKALIDYSTSNFIETLVLGSPSRGGIIKRFRLSDIPSNVCKGIPNFCAVYVIAKGKISSSRSATSAAPTKKLPSSAPNSQSQTCNDNEPTATESLQLQPQNLQEEVELKLRLTYESLTPKSGLSTGPMYPYLDNSIETELDRSDGSLFSTNCSSNLNSSHERSSYSIDSSRISWSSQNTDDVEAEMSRLKLELEQRMDMYNAACKGTFPTKYMAMGLHHWKLEDEQRLEEAQITEDISALPLVEKDQTKCKAVVEAAGAAQWMVELEAQREVYMKMEDLEESDNKTNPTIGHELGYKKYSIEDIKMATQYFSESCKIGEGGYGPVYKGCLDHALVAIKVLRSDAAQGQSQFQQEVEVLSCTRHPNIVLLLGACPDYGCLVYEHMENGSLEDRLFRIGDTPVLSWQARFRIAAEIATGLLFLHQKKPMALVHRDLKPANILLDSNYVSKISDVGLARLVPASMANFVTAYRMTSAAGTFCYIDPEYQKTGLLRTKSDVYSLGILLLQLLTAKPPMGLAFLTQKAIKSRTFAKLLDPCVPDWPIEECLRFAKLALNCAELRREDRPDLGTVILPELNRLSEIAEESIL